MYAECKGMVDARMTQVAQDMNDQVVAAIMLPPVAVVPVPAPRADPTAPVRAAPVKRAPAPPQGVLVIRGLDAASQPTN